MVHTWLYAKPRVFFTDSISKLVDQSNKCMEKLGVMFKNDIIFVLVYLLLHEENNK
jgi:hypothetical protein